MLLITNLTNVIGKLLGAYMLQWDKHFKYREYNINNLGVSHFYLDS